MNVFEKLRQVKELFIEIEESLLFEITQKLANHWHYKKHRKNIKLTKQEAQIYETYITNSLNPSTVYKWMLLVKVPSELRSKIRNYNLKQNQILKEKRELKELKNLSEQEFLNKIKNSVRRYIIR